MVQTLEAIRGGGGSIRVGTIGTISSLMTRELETSSSKSSRHTLISESHVNGPLKPRKSMDEASSSGLNTSIKHQRTKFQNQHQVPVFSPTTPRRQKQKAPLKDVGNSTVSKGINRTPDFSGKIRSQKRSYKIPMLGSENIHLEKTPIRETPTKKGSNIVDVVDIHCGNSAVSLSNRLRKLGFSKLSQSYI